MNPTVIAARAGLTRGWIEFRQSLTNYNDLAGYILPNAIFVAVMYFQRHATIPGMPVSLGARTLPSVLGMSVGFGLILLAQQLAVEREDGTLLRAKATPNGMLGYLIGKILTVTGMTLTGCLVSFVPGVVLFGDVLTDDPRAWLHLIWVILLGFAATLPIGAVLGSLLSNPRHLGLVMLPWMALVGTSGIFYPITAYPGWAQGIAQAFPLYWLGLGARSGLLPASQAALEIGGSWRHLETAAVLGTWAIMGLILAPVVLRRMARHESGSAVEARRERALQRSGR
ncbi:MAG TPA: ABC transporter permease [Actinopolymorphaceae bacterium]|jgi:ABC-2 type transport system permease protein